jgi:hypothetical protein
MISRTRLLAAVCVVSGVLVAGCGSSNSTSTTTSSTTAATTPAGATPTGTTAAGTTAATTAPTATVPTGTTSSQLKAAEAANPAVAAAVAQAVASCKTSINAQATLTASDKSKLDAICQQAGNGDTAGVQKATAQVCQEIVKDTVPAAEQTEALAACPKP